MSKKLKTKNSKIKKGSILESAGSWEMSEEEAEKIKEELRKG